jgi:hypothetical protein
MVDYGKKRPQRGLKSWTRVDVNVLTNGCGRQEHSVSHRLSRDRVPGYLSSLLEDIRAKDHAADRRILGGAQPQLSSKPVGTLKSLWPQLE